MTVYIIEPQAVEEARRVYEEGIVPVDEIVAMLGMSRHGFYRFIRDERWQLRRPRTHVLGARRAAMLASADDATEPDEACAPAVRVNRDDLLDKVEVAVNRELAQAERALANGGPRDAEKNAKVLASLARSLSQLKREPRGAQATERHDDAADEPPARDLDELKAELARRLDRLRRSRDAE
jgi:predicted DNA-binding transcriptional regulator AlpA